MISLLSSYVKFLIVTAYIHSTSEISYLHSILSALKVYFGLIGGFRICNVWRLHGHEDDIHIIPLSWTVLIRKMYVIVGHERDRSLCVYLTRDLR